MSETPLVDLPAVTIDLPTNTCGGCKHGQTAEQNFKAPLECRRFPPTITGFLIGMHPQQGPQVVNQTRYPQVQRLGPACGEWVPKFPKQN